MSTKDPAAKKRIMLVGGGRETVENLEKARALGLEVIFVQKPSLYKEALAPLVDHAVLVDYADPELLVPIARGLHRALPFATAISLSEDGLVAAANVREALRLPGNALETVVRLKDKAKMRVHLARCGVSPVAATVATSADTVVAFMRENPGPVALKPTDGSGSFAVFRVDVIDEVAAACASLAKLGVGRFLVEEYLDGPEMSVEAFTFHGRHVIVAMTDKLTSEHHVELGHSMPAALDEATRRAVADLTCAFLDAVALREGPSHTEVKLTRKGPRIVESHDRVGGDRINELVRVAYGIDMKALALGWAADVVDALPGPPAPCAAAAIRFVTPPPGVVRSVEGVDEARAMPGVVELKVTVAPGAKVRPLRESYDRVGHVLAGGSDVGEAVRRCEEVLRAVRVATSEG